MPKMKFAPKKSWCKYVRGVLNRPSAAALADQVLQNGVNFLVVALLYRTASLESVAWYATFRFAVLLVIGAQNSLISFPYTYRFRTIPETQRSLFAGTHLLFHFLFALTILIAGFLCWAFYSAGSFGTNLVSLLVTFLAAPMFLLREFSRRYEFAHLRTGNSLAYSFLAATVQVIGLGYVTSLQNLNAVTAIASLTLGNGLANLVWYSSVVKEIDLKLGGMWKRWLENWAQGKWIFGSQLTNDLILLLVQAWLTLATDPTAGGVFAAAFTLQGLCNPIIMGYSNLFPAVFARALSSGSARELGCQVLKATRQITWITTFMTLGILGLSPMFAAWSGKQLPVGATTCLLVLGLATILRAAGQASFHGLNVLGRASRAFFPRMVASVVALILVPIIVGVLGAIGACLVVFLFQAAITILSAVYFRRAVATWNGHIGAFGN
ncbi:MAG: hypothetical protein KDB03_09310 [Planctomycetales bacterium]|nr:hypothetical protein [Planctomycetales bacterium]